MPKQFGVHAESPPEGYLTGVNFDHLVLLNKRTNDGRLLRDSGFDVREIPLPFSAMFATQHGEPGQATVVGIVDEITVNDDNTVDGRGWLLDSMTARQAGTLIQRQAVRGNSVELSTKKVDLRFDPDEMKMLVDFVEYQIAATTAVSRPAMTDCFITLEDDGFDFGDLGEFSDEANASLDEADAPVRIGVGGLSGSFASFTVTDHANPTEVALAGDEPDRSWFELSDRHAKLCPVSTDADGRVWGYLASWGQPHLSVPGFVTLPPRSQCDYAYFATGSVLCSDGSFVPTGRLTYGGEHAGKEVDWVEACKHYDNTLSCWADVAIGENDLGIWIAGRVRPGTDPAVVAMGRASALSGDWRRVAGRLELVGALSVNSPGFPVPRPAAFSEDGFQVSLLSAGAIAPLWLETQQAGNLLPADALADLKVLADDLRRRDADTVDAALTAIEMDELEEALG